MKLYISLYLVLKEEKLKAYVYKAIHIYTRKDFGMFVLSMYFF